MKKLFIASVALVAALAFTSCETKTTEEQNAEQAIENAAQDAQQAVENAAEATVETVDSLANEAQEAVDQMSKEVK